METPSSRTSTLSLSLHPAVQRTGQSARLRGLVRQLCSWPPQEHALPALSSCESNPPTPKLKKLVRIFLYGTMGKSPTGCTAVGAGVPTQARTVLTQPGVLHLRPSLSWLAESQHSSPLSLISVQDNRAEAGCLSSVDQLRAQDIWLSTPIHWRYVDFFLFLNCGCAVLQDFFPASVRCRIRGHLPACSC